MRLEFEVFGELLGNHENESIIVVVDDVVLNVNFEWTFEVLNVV